MLRQQNDQLKNAQRGLEAANKELEQRVLDRTAELSTARDELQVALERAHELDRMKSQFFDNISHELRTPLSLVLLSLEYTLQQELSAPVRSYLEGMDRAADRLLRLINRLLDLARLEAGKTRLNYEAVDLRGLIEGMLPPFQVLAGSKGLQLQVETEGDVRSSVIVDLQMIEGIFQNLLGNALKFTSQGSVRVRLSELPDLAVVEVVDTGAGIPAQDLPLIFDRFAQSDSSGVRRFEGSGLGLALVREGVELHGGRVTVQSELGKGSVFRVEIPKGRSHIREELAVRGISPVRTRRRNDPYQQLTHAGFADLGKVSPAPVGELPAIPNPGGASDVPRHQVLVVEDDPELRRFLVAILRQKYRVTEAVNGAEGLQRMRSLRPEVVVSDVMMPEMSGLQMIQAARTEPALADIPVLLLTARREVDSTLNGLEVGANDYLGKPFSPPELIARIEVQLRLREAASRLAASERLAGLGILTSGFAHEVRNPLNGLLNALQPLYEMSLEGEVGDPMLLKLAMDCGTRIQDLSNSLLSLARPALELDQVRVETLLDSTIDVLRWKMPRGIEVERHYDFDGEVPGEPGPLGQVWMNLIDNALRSMGERGRLRLSTALCGEELRVRIEDDGPGIAAGDLQRLFEPFFTTRSAGEGTGLGLALCRRIVERHHGHIEVESSPGHGARFDVYLPLRMHVGADGNWQEPVRGALAS